MISTVTTTTVVALTSVPGLAASFGLMAVLVLISFLVTKELASADERPGLLQLSRALNIAIIPLMLVFIAIVAARVVAVL